MRVSLVPGGPVAGAPGASLARPEPLLEPSGARVVLGAGPFGALAQPVRPAADRLFGPRGACLAAPAGPLIVSDTGHHRLLVWSCVPESDDAQADVVIGQPDFASEGRNANGEVGAATLNVPTAIAAGSGILAVADAWNHRVLLWHGLPCRSNQPAEIVLGQADFGSGQANRGLAEPRADTLNWCFGVTIDDGRLFVADSGNRRVLVWDGIPATNGAPADLVLGQHDFATRDEGAGGTGSAVGMRWPHAVMVVAGHLFVADAGANRVMAWHGVPKRNGVSCDFVLGQADAAGRDHNRAADRPSPASLSMPHGLAARSDCLVVADTANSRLLGFEIGRLGMGEAASRLAGQDSFAEKGENRWQPPSRRSLSWPYGVAACATTLIIADTGNNRVMLWESA